MWSAIRIDSEVSNIHQKLDKTILQLPSSKHEKDSPSVATNTREASWILISAFCSLPNHAIWQWIHKRPHSWETRKFAWGWGKQKSQ